jgi:hypothetical protein
VRTITIGGRVTPTEYETLPKIASGSGQILGKWVCKVLLRGTRTEKADPHLISEMVGIQLLFMITHALMPRGEKISADQFQAVTKSVQST